MANFSDNTTNSATENEVQKGNEKNEQMSYNPSVSDDLKSELEKVKGDAIGDTLYSERFVLCVLLKLAKIEKNLSEDEEFEKELCTLWDMTIETDVVKLLLEHKVLELFSNIIRVTEDKRLTEILIGMIGNMCNISEARDELCVGGVFGPIIDLVACSDALTLIQLMRLFHTALVFENTGDEIFWFQHFRNNENFVENFAFILINSISTSLLISSFEALNAICSTFAVIEIQADIRDLSFCDVFVQPSLVMGIIEAFKTLLPNNILEKETNDETSTPTQNSQKIMNLFLDINVILSQYEKVSRKCYEPVLTDLINCISQILSPLCKPICLLPLTFNEQGIIESINELFQALGDPFDEVCFAQLITIWNLIELDRESKDPQQKWEDDDGSDKEVNSEDICMTILEFLTRTVKNSSDQLLKNSLRLHTPQTIMKLLSALSAGDSEPDIRDCRNKIKLVFDVLKKEDTSSIIETTTAAVSS